MKQKKAPMHRTSALTIERIQTGVRMEKRMVKVLKAVAEIYDRSLGELLEDIVLHSFEGARAFEGESLKRISELKKVYNMDYDAHSSYKFKEINKEDQQ